MTRTDGRQNDEMRPISIELDHDAHGEGAVLIGFGGTKLIVTASIDERVPPFLRGKGKGWVTASYGMLPRSTHSRMDRKKTAESGRTQEISRLIGRSLRGITDLKTLGECQITIDCDVIRADGGTRTAAITGGFVALCQAIHHLNVIKAAKTPVLTHSIAAISCGKVGGHILCDLDYSEDSSAAIDANFVMTGDQKLVEIQATGEQHPFDDYDFLEMMIMAKQAIKQIDEAQKHALSAFDLRNIIQNTI